MKTNQLRKLFLPAILACSLILASPLFAQDNYPQGGDNQGGDPPSRVARLSYVSGNVSFQPAGEDQWSQATLNYPLTTGDRVFTDQNSRAELETGNIAVRLAANSDLTTVALNDQLVQLGLSAGTLRVRAYDMIEGNSIEIDTANAALTLLRPGSYRVETYPDDNTTLVVVNEGDLEINGPGFSRTLHSGQAVELRGTDEVAMNYINAPYGDDFDQWCNGRDRRFLNSPSRQYVGDYVPGYDDLDQYGYWTSAPDYGPVWYPRGVAVDWVPYRYGHWAWVEPWGWTWVEDEPWGFAPFHYGRWVIIDGRWGWIPGPVVVRPVYAPALVAFVGGGGVSFGVGVQCWFPLGPRDPYYPWYHHSNVYLRQVNVTNVTVRNVTIVNNYINTGNAAQVHYAYQRTGVTAVSSDAFRTSQPVARQMVRVNAEAVARAQVIAHPAITPDRRAIAAGAPTVHPAVEQVRPRPLYRPVATPNNRNVGRNGQPQSAPGTGQNQAGDDRSYRGPGDRRTVQVQPTPTPTTGNNNDRTYRGPEDRRTVQAQPTPTPQAVTPDRNTYGRPSGGAPTPNPTPAGQNPQGNNDRTYRGPEDRRTMQAQPSPAPQAVTPDRNTYGRPSTGPTPSPAQGNAGGQRNYGGAPANAHPLVTNAPPPPPKPSFTQREPAYQEHPGRPLDPQQTNNVRQGQPAGASHDREYAPHPQQSSQPPKNDNKGNNDKGKDDKGDKGKKDR